MENRKKVIFIVLEILLIIIFTVLLTETAFRIYSRFNPTFIFPNQSYNRFRGIPFSHDYSNFKLNSMGFKDIEFKTNKHPETTRIIAIGDSFVFGVVPYEFNYLTLIENRLNKQHKSFEVFNMGIPSIGIKDYLSLLVHEGIKLNPDIVIINIFIGNDFTSSKENTSSYLFSFLKYLFKIVPDYKGKIIHGQAEYHDNEESFSDDKYLEIEAGRSSIYLKENKEIEKHITGAMTYLKRIKAICDKRRIKLLVVLIPDDVQINKSLQEKVVKIINENTGSFDFTQPNILISKKLFNEKITYVDLTKYFIDKNKREGLILYKPNDTHWNKAGNKLASEILLKEIIKLHPPTSQAN